MSATRRRILPLALAAALPLAVPATASAHASFPTASNAAGTAASPYPAGSTQTIKMAVPFEQEGVQHNGADNTTTSVVITVPTGWSGAGCGEARRFDLSAVVAGWTCALSTAGARQVLTWAGPQVAAGQTAEVSAQYFTFTVKVPSPAAPTSYGGTDSPADGFRVVQKYADGATATWRTPNDPGAGEVAHGLVRTVAAAGAATASPTPVPAAAGGQQLQVQVGDGDDPLPQTGPGPAGAVPGALLLATAGVLATGMVLVACGVDVRPVKRRTRRR